MQPLYLFCRMLNNNVAPARKLYAAFGIGGGGINNEPLEVDKLNFVQTPNIYILTNSMRNTVYTLRVTSTVMIRHRGWNSI